MSVLGTCYELMGIALSAALVSEIERATCRGNASDAFAVMPLMIVSAAGSRLLTSGPRSSLQYGESAKPRQSVLFAVMPLMFEVVLVHGCL